MFRWGSDRGSKETVTDIAARTDPPGRSSPTVRVYSLMHGGGWWTVLVQRWEDFEDHVITVRRRYLDDVSSEEEGRGNLG